MPPAKKAPAKKPAPKPKRTLHVDYIGNFGPPHSTENHVARALGNNGHRVRRIQENDPLMWHNPLAGDGYPDLVLWTRTGWDYARCGYTSQEGALGFQGLFLAQMRDVNVPVVGYHLDLWHGLKEHGREDQLDTEPFFRSDLVITADGDPEHEKDFAARGINHVWFPPGVSRDECEPGMFRDEFHSKLAFVGSHQGGYHVESRHRHELVNWLKANYRRDCAFYPEEGRPAVRGADLRDLYASVDVVVGDSCFAGEVANYWSDRIPETLGRGGFLAHPNVEGLEQHFQPFGDLVTWKAGDWDGLGRVVEESLADPGLRRAVSQHGRATVLAHHTYERRMEQLVDLLEERKLL